MAGNKKDKINQIDTLEVLVIKFQSICNKTAILEQIIKTHQPDVIHVTETWLKPDESSSEIFPDQYTVYRQDRQTDNHGGVLFA